MRTKCVTQFLINISTLKIKIMICVFILLSLLMTSQICYSQYVPNVGDKVIISMSGSELLPIFEDASDSSQLVHRLSNGEIIEILDKSGNWLKLQLSDNQDGWLHHNPDPGQYTLLKMGESEKKIVGTQIDSISTNAKETEASEDSLKQEEADTSEFEIEMEGLTSIAYQFYKIFDEYEINYYGLTGEIIPKNKFSYSASLLLGKGSNDTYFLHIPAIGTVVGFGVLSVAQWFDFNMKASEFFLFFLLENFHYNIPLNKHVMLSPSITICGADIGAGEGSNQGSIILTNGIGLGMKLFPTESFMINSSIYFKHFYISGNTNLDKGGHFGFTAMINMGFIF